MFHWAGRGTAVLWLSIFGVGGLLGIFFRTYDHPTPRGIGVVEKAAAHPAMRDGADPSPDTTHDRTASATSASRSSTHSPGVMIASGSKRSIPANAASSFASVSSAHTAMRTVPAPTQNPTLAARCSSANFSAS